MVVAIFEVFHYSTGHFLRYFFHCWLNSSFYLVHQYWLVDSCRSQPLGNPRESNHMEKELANVLATSCHHAKRLHGRETSPSKHLLSFLLCVQLPTALQTFEWAHDRVCFAINDS